MFSLILTTMSCLTNLVISRMATTILMCPVVEPKSTVGLGEVVNEGNIGQRRHISYTFHKNLLDASHDAYHAVKSFWNNSDNMIENGFQPITDRFFTRPTTSPDQVAKAFQELQFDLELIGIVDEEYDLRLLYTTPIHNQRFAEFVVALMEHRQSLTSTKRDAFDSQWG